MAVNILEDLHRSQNDKSLPNHDEMVFHSVSIYFLSLGRLDVLSLESRQRDSS